MNDDSNSSDENNRCEAEVAIVPDLGTTADVPKHRPLPTAASTPGTIDTSSNCPCHCQTSGGDNHNPCFHLGSQSVEEPFSLPTYEELRLQMNTECATTPSTTNKQNFTPHDCGISNSTISSERIAIPFSNDSNLMSADVTITIGDGQSEPTTFELQANEIDIGQVLKKFNAILDNVDLTFSSSVDEENCGSLDLNCASAGEGSDDKELLILINDRENNLARDCDYESETNLQSTSPLPDTDTGSGTGDEPEEGYESDRPMVRASMRKLKPVKMLPMPSLPQTINEIQTPDESPGSPNSFAMNRTGVVGILADSAPGYTDGASASTNANRREQCNNSSATTTTGSQSQCHSRNPSYNSNSAFISSNGNATDLTMCAVAVTDLVDTLQPQSSVQSKSNIHYNNSVQTSSASVPVAGYSGGMNVNSLYESSNNSPIFSLNNSSPPLHPTLAVLEETIRLQNEGLASPNEAIRVETAGIIGPAAALSLQDEDASNATDASPSTGPRNSTGRRHDAYLHGGNPPGYWPHRLSSVLALIGCTLGLNNICRFGLLSVEYGANFTIQFVFLSLVFGIPLLTFHMSSGQYLASGIIDMWKISPIFQGIGIGLVISQAMVGVYTAVGVSWMFIYFRDSFITRYDLYRWAKCFRDYRDCDQFLYNSTQLVETVPDYFNGVVLQRGSPEYPSANFPSSSLKFTVTFNLAVVWMLIFVSLSKGLKSYGKAIHGFVLLPVVAILVLASKMVGLVPSDETSSLFGQTAWSNFFLNSQTWVIAAREVFFTWGLLGACVMQVTSHNKPTHSLKSDASIVVLITTVVLLLTAFLGNACYSVLVSHGYTYVASSFESEQTYKFLIKKPPDTMLPSSMNYHTSFLMGVRIVPMSDMPNGSTVSGYQVLRLATELFPATMAVLGSQGLSPFWTVLFYFTFILFGIAQQLAIWYCVIKGVIAVKAKTLKSWETTITFFVCGLGFLFGLPLCTEFGIFVEYFLDFVIGSGWWIMVLYLLELIAVFIVRGAPYCGENIVTVLMTGRGKLTKFFAPLISFLWNVILPVAMLVLSITSFKSGNIRELYDWNPLHGYAFWPSWTRELGTLLQLIPILTVPFVAIVQSCRYLTNGPPDLFDRIQQLYRPHSRGLLGRTLSEHLGRNGTDSSRQNGTQNRAPEDAPPKYTPPPSYSTATSARIAKFLRASFRRSLRRLPGGSHSSENLPPPPNYASVILEINSQSQRAGCSSGNPNSIPTTSNHENHPVVLPIFISPPGAAEANEIGHHGSPEEASDPVFKINVAPSYTLGRHLEPSSVSSEKAARGSLRRIASDITPREVARILRASFRQSCNDKTSDIPNENTNSRDCRLRGNEFGLDQSDHLRLSNFGFTKNLNFDFSRKRRSNDSQRALISSQSRNNSIGSNELPCYADLEYLGIINSPSSPAVSGSSNIANTAGSGHVRSQSLTVPTPYQSFA